MFDAWALSFMGTDFSGTPPPVSTSYSNPGGTGDRTSIITVATNQAFVGSPSTLVNGAFANECYWGNNSLFPSDYLSFDFGSAKVIDEFKFYQSSPIAQANWIFQGSNDNLSWTDLGSSFALNTGTFPVTNTSAYRYYRLRGVSGTTSAGPYLHEFEFKISA